MFTVDVTPINLDHDIPVTEQIELIAKGDTPYVKIYDKLGYYKGHLLNASIKTLWRYSVCTIEDFKAALIRLAST